MSTPSKSPSAYVRYERDEDGVVYAVEIIDADQWSDEFTRPLDPERADLRLVRMRRGPLPADLPGWLLAERAAGGVSDLGTTYDVATPIEASWRLHPARRQPGAMAAEYLDAITEAASYPLEPASEPGRRQALVHHIAARYDAFSPLRHLASDALERWLAVRFGTPERATDTLLLARIQDRDAAIASRLEFLRDALVPPTYPQLAFDRELLLQQASPRRVLDGGLPPAVVASLDEWIRRYRHTYDGHYRAMLATAKDALDMIERSLAAREALERLNGLRALGRAEGEEACASLDRARAQLAALPARLAGDAPMDGVPLGEHHPAVTQARRAVRTIERLVRRRLRRLARELSGRILEDEGLAEIERVLRAMQASETAELAHIFDDALLARIDGILSHAEPSPLARLAEDFPVITDDDVDSAVDSFRTRLLQALADAPGGRIRLRPTARLGSP